MRTTVLSFVSFFILFLEVIILSTIISHSSYKASVEAGLEDSVTTAVSMLQEGYKDKVSGYIEVDDLKQSFVNYLAENIDARIKGLTVNFYGADEETGVLSVEVYAKFNYQNGREAEVSCYRTAILNTTLK